MADIKRCGILNAHAAHEWSELVKVPPFSSRLGGVVEEVTQPHYCEGAPESRSAEGKLESLKQVEYRNLKRVRFEFENRERVDTEIAFEDILPTDGVARITVLEEDKGWANVEIRILARKPYIAREVETDGR